MRGFADIFRDPCQRVMDLLLVEARQRLDDVPHIDPLGQRRGEPLPQRLSRLNVLPGAEQEHPVHTAARFLIRLPAQRNAAPQDRGGDRRIGGLHARRTQAADIGADMEAQFFLQLADEQDEITPVVIFYNAHIIVALRNHRGFQLLCEREDRLLVHVAGQPVEIVHLYEYARAERRVPPAGGQVFRQLAHARAPREEPPQQALLLQDPFFLHLLL